MNRDNITPVSPPDAPVSPPNAPVSSPDEDLGKALIKETATNARKLLIYSRAEGLSPQETLFSMVLCVATLADALEMDEGTVCAGIHAALADLNSADEEE